MISSQQLGSRIEAARKLARLTQADVAARLGFSRQTLIAMEKGARRPSDEQLVVLATTLGVTLHELVRERYVEGSPSARYRAANRAPSDDLRSAETMLVAMARRYAELEQLLGVVRTRTPLEAVTNWQAGAATDRLDPSLSGEEAARAVRQMLGLGDAPALALDTHLERVAGLRIFGLLLPASVAALFIWTDVLGGCVGVNVRHPHARQRWSLAHEMGHFLRDREAGDVLPDYEPTARDAGEVFSDSFALNLLMPQDSVSRHFADRVRVNGGAFAAVDILALADSYEVSFQAMTRRLEQFRLLPNGTWNRLSAGKIGPAAIAVHQGTTRPPRGEARPTFPERYSALAFESFERDLIGEGDLAEYLACDRITARELYAERRERLHGAGTDVELGFDVLATG